MDFNARFYDPMLGRFMNIDPMSYKRDWLTPYNYAQNSPIILSDPSGLLDKYSLDTETGDIDLVEETDDATDELVDSKTGETISDEVDKGLLFDGQNIMENGLETSNVKGGQILATDISFYTNDEVGGVTYKNQKSGSLFLKVLPYEHSNLYRNESGEVIGMGGRFSLNLGDGKFTSKDGSFSGNAILAFHTHPGHPEGRANDPNLGLPFPSYADDEIVRKNAGINKVIVPFLIYGRKGATYKGVTSDVAVSIFNSKTNWVDTNLRKKPSFRFKKK